MNFRRKRKYFKRKRKYSKHYDMGDTVSCPTMHQDYKPAKGQVISSMSIQGVIMNYYTDFSMISPYHYNNLRSCKMLLLERV